MIVLLGAHTPVGEAVVACLQERGVPGVVRATTSEHIADELVLVDAELMARGDLFVLCAGGSFFTKIAETLVAQDKLLIDLSGETSLPLRMFRPQSGMRPESPFRVPLGMVEPLAELVWGCRQLTPKRVLATVMTSAAVAGRAGIDELSEQSRGVFTMQKPEPEVFGASLAFDLVPYRGEDGEGERRFEADVRAAAGLPELEVVVRRILVPSFSAEGATVFVEFGEATTEAELREMWSSSAGLRLQDGLLPSLDALDRDDAQLGHLRVDKHWASLWLVADRLRRGGPTQAALWVEAFLADKKSAGST